MKLTERIKRLFGIRQIPEIPDGWTEAGGEGVTVCVIDSGAPTHPRLEECIDYGMCRSFAWDEPQTEDMDGHATAVCGTIHQYAPLARMFCLKASRKGGKVESAELRNALEAAAEAKPDIVYCGATLECGASKCLHAIGVLAAAEIPLICPAGNNGGDRVDYPARFPQAVCVGACDRRGRRARFSPDAPEIDCLFPGTRIPTFWLRGGQAVVSGTCFSAAAATGTAALYIAFWRNLNNLSCRRLPIRERVLAAIKQCGVEVNA